jgi:hypothetical protein
MVSEVRGQYLKGKFKHMTRRELAVHLNNRRNVEKMSWWDIEVEVGLSDKALRRIMRLEGFGLEDFRYVNTKNAERNQFIIDRINAKIAAGQEINQQELADEVTKAGWPSNRKVVNGVIDRARESGLISREFDALKSGKNYGPRGASGRGKVSYGFMGSNRIGPGEPEGLPPRTPELLAKGRVAFDDLTPSMCRYTPSEDAPFFFCGEAVTGGLHTSIPWCKDCLENIIRRPPHGNQKKTSEGEAEAFAA